MNVYILSPQKRWAMKPGVFDPAEKILQTHFSGSIT